MIKRVFKTIFILTLCLGITLPANAGSVQVSNGSAFITKAELSYKLNNLSNRMTILENSLDSKIDNLVSSYLTRNGIWNGAVQTLSSYTKLNNTINGTATKNIYKSKTYGILNKIVDGLSYDYYTLVANASKTGLVNVLANSTKTGISIHPIGANHSGWYFSKTGGTNYSGHTYFRDVVRYYGLVSLKLYVNDGCVFTQKVMSAQSKIEETPTAGVGYLANWCMMWNPLSISAYFFCNKGDTISWNLTYTAIFGEIFSTSVGNGDVRGNGTFDFKITKCVIY